MAQDQRPGSWFDKQIKTKSQKEVRTSLNEADFRFFAILYFIDVKAIISNTNNEIGSEK